MGIFGGLFSRHCSICGDHEGEHSEYREQEVYCHPETSQPMGGGKALERWYVNLSKCEKCGKLVCSKCEENDICKNCQ